MRYEYVSDEMNEGKRQFGRSRLRWKDIKMDIKEMEYESVGWFQLKQTGDQRRAFVNRVMKLWVP
jgi:hypothetical protein